MLRSTTITAHVILITCLLIGGAAHASDVFHNDSTFTGFSFGGNAYTGNPVVGFMGSWDYPLGRDQGIGVVGIGSFDLTDNMDNYAFSAFLNFSDFWDSCIFHAGVGFALGSDAYTYPRPAVQASITYNLGAFSTDQFAVDLGVQWVPDGAITFTISPGFWAE